MFNTLYVLSGYNNYINRKLKFENTINEYLEFDNMIFTGVNFNPNDEISTEVTLNFRDYATADYVIVADEAGQNIVGRWFIIDRVRVRGNQWNFTLRRDVVADYWNVIKTAPCFIEKAILDYDDYRLFNKEDMTFNQIKTEETLLKDNSGCPWIVFYADKDFTLSGAITTNKLLDVPFIQLDSTIENWDYYNASNLSDNQAPIESTSGNTLIQYSINRRTGSRHYDLVVDTYGNTISGSDNPGAINGYKATTDDPNAIIQQIKNNMERVGNELIYNNAKSLFNVVSDTVFENMIALKGQLLRDIEGRVFRVANINSKVISPSYNTFKTVSVGSSLYLNLVDVMSGVTDVTGSATIDSFKVATTLTQYTLELEEQEQLELTYDISGARIKTEDTPYDIFAIPYGALDVYTVEEGGGEQTLCRTSAEIAINAATAIQKAGTTAKIYDVQILPYCPVQELIQSVSNELYLTSALQYSTIKQGETVKGIIINVPNSRFSFNIQHSIGTATNSIERKVNHQCDKWRLASPNYNSYFDFSVEMNNGVQYFNVDCEYKPYNPYIHVNPDFKGLYGQDFNDPRGLVCGGDFSIAQINDQWNQYQIQNKNFQNIFDRQIKNMEEVGEIQRTLDIVNTIAGAAQGAVSGASIAALVPGLGFTMGTGALAGGGISAAAGIVDIALNEVLRNKAINFAKDNFGYQLGNIQALPDVLSRISAFNNNNKFFPVLEYYTCTEVEKEAFRNKIKYNGMTVMTIGKIEDYITYDTSYIKGQLIQLPLVNDDFHVANTIVGEVNKGLYIEGGYING